jgi:hypothetical protein
VSDKTNRDQAAEVLDTMTDDDLAAWVQAGDFTSIGDVQLSDDDAERIATAVGWPEVAGYTFGLGMEMGLKPQGFGGTPAGLSSLGHPGGHTESHHDVSVFRIAIKDVLIPGLSL